MIKNKPYKSIKAIRYYFYLLKKFGEPGDWPWFGSGPKHTKEEIIISAILTQGANWQNVEKALNNLQREKLNALAAIYESGGKDLSQLQTIVRPSGFYRQKGERLFRFSKFVIENYGNIKKLFSHKTDFLREEMLKINGIGKETADTILLYAGNKPIFVIDEYTKRFAKKYKFCQKTDYDYLQNYFYGNLPKNVKLYKDYHALIVLWGKNNRKNEERPAVNIDCR